MKRVLGKRIVSIGHQAKGEKHWNAKLDAKKVSEVVFLYGSNYSYKAIAKLTKVSVPTIAAICTGRRWRSVTADMKMARRYKPTKSIKTKIKASEVRFIRDVYEAGAMSQPQLAKLFKVSQCTISEIVNGVNRR